MRTTIQLDQDLLIEAKRHAVETGRTLTQLIREALVALLAAERRAASPCRTSLPVFGADGLQEGVDINNTSSLLDRTERLSGLGSAPGSAPC